MGRSPGSGRGMPVHSFILIPRKLYRFPTWVTTMRTGVALLTFMQSVMQAAQCKEPADQASLLHRIDAMSAEVADAGISLKYSKKVRQDS